MVFCTYCGQSFTRDEHLERHILTHTNVKPFRCFSCHMTFARRDLLQRHYTVHGKEGSTDPNAANGIIPKSAGRTPIACHNCAKTKTKCDKKFPCSRCASRNLKCTARPTRRTSKNAPAAAPGEGNVSREEATTELQIPTTISTPPPEVKTLFLDQMPLPPDELTPPGSSGQNSPLNSSPPNGQLLSSPIVDTNMYFQQSGMPYDELRYHGGHSHSSHSSIDTTTSSMMFDWSHMQLSAGCEPMARSDMLMSPTAMSFPPGETMLNQGEAMNYIPDFNTSLSMQTPLPTPTFDGGFPSLELDHSGAMRYSNGFQQPDTPPNGEADAITAAQEGWTVFRCTPAIAPHLCPKTARLNLERLQESLRSPRIWSNWQPMWDDVQTTDDQLAIIPLQEMARDKLMAITQSVLHKALDIHKYEQALSPSGSNSPTGQRSNFVLLPPSRVLDHFFKSYSNNFESYFPLTPKGTVNADELMHGNNDKASSLLLLLMIAQGAMTIPGEARWLTSGLTEACRISLFDLIEKNIIMASDPTVLRAALIFTVQAAWSGDKWLMDIAAGQKGMYFAMLRHSGILEDRQNSYANSEMCASIDNLWNDWVEKESRSRLIYSWAMADQDLSLLHDTVPSFSVTEFGAPMPDSDLLWRATSAAQWSAVAEQVKDFSGGFSAAGSRARPLSLRELFRHFLDDTIVSQGIELTALQLRLLLHPLQTLVCQYRQLLSCFSNTGLPSPVESSSPLTAESTRSRVGELQSMLQRWWSLYQRYAAKSSSQSFDPMMQAALVVFHLISLNTVTNFPEIERLARKEAGDSTYSHLCWMHKCCISEVERAVYHCGQILMLVRTMPRNLAPPWWPGAIYRAGLVLWADSLVHKETLTPNSGFFPNNGAERFAIDAVAPDHPVVMHYLSKGEGVPTLTKKDGSLVELDSSFAVLSHCVELIDETAQTRLGEGLRNKLMRVASQKV